MKNILLALNASFSHTSLSGRYLRAACLHVGLEIELLELTINERAEQIAAAVFAREPDFLACSVYIWNVRLMQDVCTRIKIMKPEITIIWGGPEVSHDALNVLQEQPFIDYICTGEGEVSFSALLQALAHGNPNLPKILSEERLALDKIPDPYEGEGEFQKNKLYYFESSRGCPYACSYCLSSAVPGVRFLPLDITKKRLSQLAQEVPIVKFVDRTFNANPERARDIWAFLMQLPGKCRFHFEICAHLLEDQDFELLARPESKRFQFEVGLQTTSPEALQSINRSMDTQKLLENVVQLQSFGTVEIHLDLIAGLPGESYLRFMETLNQALSTRPHRLHLGFLKLLPGTPLRHQQEELGLSFLPYAPYEVLSTPNISAEQLLKLKTVEDRIDRFYNSRKLEYSLPYVLDLASGGPGGFFEHMSEAPGESLYETLFRDVGSEVDKELLLDLLRLDYLLHEPHRKVPDWMNQGFDEAKKLRELIYGPEERLYELLPHRRGERPGFILRSLRLVSLGESALRRIGSTGAQFLLIDHSQEAGNKLFAL